MAGTGGSSDAAALSAGQARAAEAVLAAAFTVLMAVLVAVGWRTGGSGSSDLAKNLAVLVPALFGAVINPRRDGNAALGEGPGAGLVRGRTWVGLTVVGLAAVVCCGLAVTLGRHPDGAAALTAALAAFAGLFVDTSTVTHAAGTAKAGARTAPVPVQGPARAPERPETGQR